MDRVPRYLVGKVGGGAGDCTVVELEVRRGGSTVRQVRRPVAGGVAVGPGRTMTM